MAVAGAIAARTKAILPITWDALAADSRYGESLLRSTIDSVKERTTGENVSPLAEVTTYSVPVIDYLAKLSALELISPGIDFWMNQPLSESATGTSENHSFADRIGALQDQRVALIAETRKLADEISPILDIAVLKRAPRASINTQNDDFLTPSPQEFSRPFVRTARS